MIRQSRALAVLALAAALPASSRAQEPPTPAAEGPVLELSLDDVVQRAMENNVDIAVERFEPESSELAIRQARGVWDPVLTSELNQNSRTDPARNVFAGGEKVDTDTFTFNVGGLQSLRTGGNARVDFINNRADTNNVFSTFNPSFGSTFNANLAQPLLRDFRIDANRLQLKVAKKNREISDVQFRQTVVNTVANVKNLYYDLLYAIDNLEVQRKSLALADRFLEENQIKVRVGTLAPLDVVAAESEKASREEAVILAEAALLDAEDELKRSIFPENDPAMWALKIVPVDRPTAEPVAVDLPAAVARALGNRTDILAARKGLENAETNVKFARNQTLPALDVVAAYGVTGVGGTFLEREGFGGPIIRTVPGGFSDALSNVFGRDFPTWTLGVNFSYPLFNRQAKAAAARARVDRDQTVASLRRLEMQITAEVRSAARAVETNFKRVESTRAARILQERRLDAETKKFGAGMSTNFLVTQSQRDLAVAEVAELRAMADYRRSLVNFERVQEAGLGGAGANASVSLTTARTSTTPIFGSTQAQQSGTNP